MPEDLHSLTILFSCEDFGHVNDTANVVMNYIDNERLPEQTYFNLRIDFPGEPLNPLIPLIPFASFLPPDTSSKWMNKAPPSKLLDIELTLIYITPDWELMSRSSSMGSEGAHSEVETLFNLEGPKDLILNIRRKLGEDFHIAVETLYYTRDGIKEFQREEYSYPDSLLYSPIQDAEITYHCDSCDSDNVGENMESDETGHDVDQLGSADVEMDSE